MKDVIVLSILLSVSLARCPCKQDEKETKCGGVSITSVPEGCRVDYGHLILSNTNITRLKANSFSHYAHLTTLRIVLNKKLRNIDAEAFSGLPYLQTLEISHGEIRHLHPDAFKGLKTLKFLYLDANRITNITDIAYSLRVEILPNLYRLKLSDNPLQQIKNDSFLSLQGSLVHDLQIVSCGLIEIHPNAFTPFKNISRIQLNNNPFVEKEEYSESFTHVINNLPSTVYALGFSNIRNFRNTTWRAIASRKLTEVFLGPTPASFFTDGIVMPNLKNITFKLVGRLPFLQTSLSELLSTKFPNLEGVKTDGSLVSVKPFFTPKLKTLVLKYRSITLTTCYEGENCIFSLLSGLNFLSLSGTQLTTVINKAFVGLKSLNTLNLKRCKIEAIFSDAFYGLDKLVDLNLADNEIKSLPSNVFDHTPSLRKIDLSKNLIINWRTPVFHQLKQMSVIKLRANNIFTFSDVMIEDLKGKSCVDVFSKFYRCDCDILPFWSWYKHDLKIRQNSSFVDGIQYDDYCDEWIGSKFVYNFSKYTCNDPYEWNNRPIAEYVEEASCSWSPVNLLIGLGVFVAIGICLAVLARIYIWHLRYLIFRVKLKFCYRSVGSADLDRTFINDAFVLYSHLDAAFTSNLVSTLENNPPYFKLCIYERDFLAGSMLTEAVLDSINNSRTFIFILTENFVKSQWCLWELTLIHHIMLEEQRLKSLILVKMGDIPTKHITPTLKYLMKNRIYLEWSSISEQQNLFWHKLKKVLHDRVKEMAFDNVISE